MTTNVSIDRHGPNRFSSYRQIHETVIHQYIDQGFIGHHNLEFSATLGKIVLEGEIACQGDIVISVAKTLDILDWHGNDGRVRTRSYAYNVRVRHCGNILRYDNGDKDYLRPGHFDEHHKHEFDWRDGTEYAGSPCWIGAHGWPLLGEVISEVRDWYWDTRLLLPNPDEYATLDPPGLD